MFSAGCGNFSMGFQVYGFLEEPSFTPICFKNGLME